MGVQALGGALTLPGKAKFILTGLKPHAHDLISGLVDKGIGAKVNDVIALSANAAITTFEGGLASATAKLAAVRIRARPSAAFRRSSSKWVTADRPRSGVTRCSVSLRLAIAAGANHIAPILRPVPKQPTKIEHEK